MLAVLPEGGEDAFMDDMGGEPIDCGTPLDPNCHAIS